ncbi:MAG: mechanosensitive ion channel [SAR324 cluster bacterium]|nr:mechanosensitive ion channel [SAR324 cluster bacterium]
MSDILKWSPFIADNSPRVIGSIVLLILLWLCYSLIHLLWIRRLQDPNLRYNWRQGINYTTLLLAIILVGRLWMQGLQPILTFLGIIAAALTITQKELIMNLVGGWFIIWRGLFKVGDRIEIGDHKGDVVANGLFYFTILEVGRRVDPDQSSGCLIKVPNNQVLIKSMVNHTRSFPYIWRETRVVVTPDSAYRDAEKILLDIAEKHTQTIKEAANEQLKNIEDEVIIYHTLNPKVYIQPKMDKPAGICLTLRFLGEPRSCRDLENEIWDETLKMFDQREDIWISYDISTFDLHAPESIEKRKASS